MLQVLVPLVAGLLFGAGLTVSQMVNPAKVLAFLDLGGIPTGTWDPSLAFVMAGALIATALGYRLAFRLGKPVCAPQFHLPTRKDVDAKLVAGAVAFGIGWGLVGYCPGPALASLAFGQRNTFIFIGSMVIGMMLYRLVFEPRIGQPGTGRTVRPSAGI